jgi:hypothetical protein
MRQLIVSLCVVCGSVGCADKLEAKAVADAGSADADLVKSGKFASRDKGDGVTETIADATVTGEQQYFDLDTGTSVSTDEGWDLAFMRNYIRSNGGASGDKRVEVARLEDTAFDDVTQAPDDGYDTDQPDGSEDDNTEPETQFSGHETSWYDYNLNTHVLSPRKVTYVVHSSEGAYFKIGIENFYDKAGTGGFLTFLWAKL